MPLAPMVKLRIDVVVAGMQKHRPAKAVRLERHRGHGVDRRLDIGRVVAGDWRNE